MQISGPDLMPIGSLSIGCTQPTQIVCSESLAQLKHNAHMIASNPNTAPSILEGLARVCNSSVLEHVATNPNTPAHILEMLLESPVSEVRAALAENMNTPFHCLWRLVQDEDPDVRYQLAENHNLSHQVLCALTEDDNPYVASRAQQTLERLRREPVPETAKEWQDFRRAQLNKRIAQMRDLENGTPLSFFSKMFGNIARYARAI
jgi:hypothetical protein